MKSRASYMHYHVKGSNPLAIRLHSSPLPESIGTGKFICVTTHCCSSEEEAEHAIIILIFHLIRIALCKASRTMREYLGLNGQRQWHRSPLLMFNDTVP